MRLAFLIQRQNGYRFLGPVIDEALRRGHEAVCWLDGLYAPGGGKSYLQSDPEKVPHFRHGQPQVRTFSTREELAAGLRGAAGLLALVPPTKYLPGGARPCPWFCLQETVDFFCGYPPAEVLAADDVFYFTPYWLETGLTYYRLTGRLTPGDPREAELRERAIFTGAPFVECAHLIDRAAVRREWNLPADRPVVTLLPFPNYLPGFWSEEIFGQPGRRRQLWRILQTGQWRFLPEVLFRRNDEAFLDLLQQFCRREGAWLVAKTRRKSPPPGYWRGQIDQVIEDDGYYPYASLKLLAVSELCVHFTSTASLEALFLGTPALCWLLNARDVVPPRPEIVRAFYHDRADGMFALPGVSRAGFGAELFRTLRTARLSDFRVDPQRQAQESERLLGNSDGLASARIVSRIETGG